MFGINRKRNKEAIRMKRTSFYYVRPLNSCAHNQHYDCKITFPCMLSIFIPAPAKIAVDDEIKHLKVDFVIWD